MSKTVPLAEGFVEIPDELVELAETRIQIEESPGWRYLTIEELESLTIKKHAVHDQSDHGNWARGTVKTHYHGTTRMAADKILEEGFRPTDVRSVARLVEEEYGLEEGEVYNHEWFGSGRWRAEDPYVYFTDNLDVARSYAESGSEMLTDALRTVYRIQNPPPDEPTGTDWWMQMREWAAKEADRLTDPVILEVDIPKDVTEHPDNEYMEFAGMVRAENLKGVEVRVRKHAVHDQSTHGNWADGTAGPLTKNGKFYLFRGPNDKTFHVLADTELSRNPEFHPKQYESVSSLEGKVFRGEEISGGWYERNEFDWIGNPDLGNDPEETVCKICKARLIAKHYGPGPHPGTGSPQEAHAGTGATSDPDDPFARDAAYDPPIDHKHPVGARTERLLNLLEAGAPVRRRFKEHMATYAEHREALVWAYEAAVQEEKPLANEEGAYTRRLNKSLYAIAKLESQMYDAPDRDALGALIRDALSDPDRGVTITQRLDSIRAELQSPSTSIDIELTRAQLENVQEREEYILDRLGNDSGWTVEVKRGVRSGKVNGGVLHISTPEAQKAWAKEAVYRAETERMDAGYYGGSLSRAKMWNNLAAKINAGDLRPGYTRSGEMFVKMSFSDSSGYLWDKSQALDSSFWTGWDPAETPVFADEMTAKLVAPSELMRGAGIGDYNWGRWTLERDEWVVREDDMSAPDLRIVPADRFFERVLMDANYSQNRVAYISPKLDAIQAQMKKNTSARLALRRDMIAEFLESEGIATGVEVNVKSKRGVAKKLVEDSKYMPAKWIATYNEWLEGRNRTLTVRTKSGGGGQYWSSKLLLMTDGTTDTNVHELGHGLEDLPAEVLPGGVSMHSYVRDFVDYRTNGRSIPSTRSRSGRKYSDSFNDPYSGVVYDWGDFEALSNGLGGMYGGHRGEPDDEHYDFLFGLMLETAK